MYNAYRTLKTYWKYEKCLFIVLMDALLVLTSEASGRFNETWAGMWVYFVVLENNHDFKYMLLSDATINDK